MYEAVNKSSHQVLGPFGSENAYGGRAGEAHWHAVHSKTQDTAEENSAPCHCTSENAPRIGTLGNGSALDSL